MSLLRLKTYWRHHAETGSTLELEFKEIQVSDRGWIVDDRGLPFIKAAIMVDEWNRLGNKNGYHYYLHKPEV
jgi:hypothetical protein